MNIRSILFLGLIAVVAAHKKCNKGFGGKLMKFIKPGKFPGCFKELSMSKTQMESGKSCFMEVRQNTTEITSIDDIVQAFMSMMQCTADKFEIIVDNTLSVDKIKAEIDNFGGPEELKTEMKNIIDTCAASLTDITDPMEMLGALTECKMTAMFDYCNVEGRDPGYLTLLNPLMTLAEPSQCDIVNMTAVVKPVFESCLAELEIDLCDKSSEEEDDDCSGSSEEMEDESEEKGGKRKGRRGGRGGKRGGRGKRPRDMIKKMKAKKQMMDMKLKMFKCIDNGLGYLDANEKIDTAKLFETIQSFPGYADLPEEIKTNMTESITECTPTEGQDFTPAMVETMPWISRIEDQYMKDGILFTRCFMPRYANICGLRNELSFFFFPMLESVLPEAVMNEIVSTSWEPDCPAV